MSDPIATFPMYPDTLRDFVARFYMSDDAPLFIPAPESAPSASPDVEFVEDE